MTDELTLDEVERLLAAMQRYSVSAIDFRGLKLTRIPDGPAPRPAHIESELEMLSKLPPDQVDAKLTLQRIKRTS